MAEEYKDQDVEVSRAMTLNVILVDKDDDKRNKHPWSCAWKLYCLPSFVLFLWCGVCGGSLACSLDVPCDCYGPGELRQTREWYAGFCFCINRTACPPFALNCLNRVWSKMSLLGCQVITQQELDGVHLPLLQPLNFAVDWFISKPHWTTSKSLRAYDYLGC